MIMKLKLKRRCDFQKTAEEISKRGRRRAAHGTEKAARQARIWNMHLKLTRCKGVFGA